MENDQVPYEQWTSCEFYGHQFVQDEENPSHHHCTDCGEEYDD